MVNTTWAKRLPQATAGWPARARRRVSDDVLGTAISFLPVLLILVLFILPLAVILLYSFWTDGVTIRPPWTLENYAQFFDSSIYFRLMVRSLRIATMVVVLSILVAFPVAYIIARIVPARWRFLVLAAIMIPSLSSFLVRTYAFIIILNERGPVNDTLLRIGLIDQPLSLLYNETAVFVGLLNVYIPWMVLPIYASLHKIDNSLYEAAQNLGASRVQIWRELVIPLSKPGVIAGAFLAFIPAIGSYATPLILGGSSAELFANAINSQFGVVNDWPFGAALSVILLGVILIFIALYHRFGNVDRVWES